MRSGKASTVSAPTTKAEKAITETAVVPAPETVPVMEIDTEGTGTADTTPTAETTPTPETAPIEETASAADTSAADTAPAADTVPAADTAPAAEAESAPNPEVSLAFVCPSFLPCAFRIDYILPVFRLEQEASLVPSRTPTTLNCDQKLWQRAVHYGTSLCCSGK